MCTTQIIAAMACGDQHQDLFAWSNTTNTLAYRLDYRLLLSAIYWGVGCYIPGSCTPRNCCSHQSTRSSATYLSLVFLKAFPVSYIHTSRYKLHKNDEKSKLLVVVARTTLLSLFSTQHAVFFLGFCGAIWCEIDWPWTLQTVWRGHRRKRFVRHRTLLFRGILQRNGILL